ncbi:MAG: CDP-alcohol phosphatidyltransferase family protein [Bryobacteraceae bacterium]
MPSVYDLKPRFQSLLRPLIGWLATVGVTANQVTVFACLISVAVGLDLSFGSRRWWLLPVWLFLRMALNAMDGMLAREHGQVSRLGALLNELTDVVSDAALLLPFAFLPGWNPVWVGAVVVLAGLTEMTSLVGQTLIGDRRNDGPMGKSDRALVMGAVAAWVGMGWQVNGVVAPLMALLCAATIYNRARHILAKGE